MTIYGEIEYSRRILDHPWINRLFQGELTFKGEIDFSRGNWHFKEDKDSERVSAVQLVVGKGTEAEKKEENEEEEEAEDWVNNYLYTKSTTR